jgi:hypothetical protein
MARGSRCKVPKGHREGGYGSASRARQDVPTRARYVTFVPQAEARNQFALERGNPGLNSFAEPGMRRRNSPGEEYALRFDRSPSSWHWRGDHGVRCGELNCYRRPLARVRAALRAACTRPRWPLVRTAFIADRCRALAPRDRAVLRACLLRELREAALLPSRLRARLIARDRRADGLRCRGERPFLNSRLAFSRV